jgi:hypothetical protein
MRSRWSYSIIRSGSRLVKSNTSVFLLYFRGRDATRQGHVRARAAAFAGLLQATAIFPLLQRKTRDFSGVGDRSPRDASTSLQLLRLSAHLICVHHRLTFISPGSARYPLINQCLNLGLKPNRINTYSDIHTWKR